MPSRLSRQAGIRLRRSARPVLFRVLAVAFVVMLTWWGVSARGSAAQATNSESPAPAPTPAASFYEAEFSRTSLPGGAGLPQDITGQVVDRFGRGQGGVLVRISSPGWEAFTSTDGNGEFRFTVVNEGSFNIELPQVPSSPAFVTINKLSSVRITFRERAATPTAVPTVAQPKTATPFATPTSGTATTTTTVTTTSTVALQPTATPTPPLTPTPAPEPVERRSLGTPNLGSLSLAAPFLLGGGLALVLFLAGLVVVVLRR